MIIVAVLMAVKVVVVSCDLCSSGSVVVVGRVLMVVLAVLAI